MENNGQSSLSHLAWVLASYSILTYSVKGPLVVLAISHVFKTLGAYGMSATVLRAKEPKMDKNIFKEPALKVKHRYVNTIWYKVCDTR